MVIRSKARTRQLNKAAKRKNGKTILTDSFSVQLTLVMIKSTEAIELI